MLPCPPPATLYPIVTLKPSLRYEVDLAGDVLAVTLHVTNPGEAAFDFQVRYTADRAPHRPHNVVQPLLLLVYVW